MTDKQSIHLPTEVLISIATALYSIRPTDEPDRELLRQHDMHQFCLVSRQWYSAGISFLYRQPQLFGGNRFAKFTRTICPPSRERKPTLELGSMVESLWLNKLVHHSSNSITARLLSRTHQSLVEFVAPRVSFSVNGLAALAKCYKLRFLNLSQVDAKSITFPRLKKAISSLSSLKGLHLPTRIPLTWTDPSAGSWPSSLTLIKVGGHLDFKLMHSFEWPRYLEELILYEGRNMDLYVFQSIFANAQLARTLKRLVISSINDVMVDSWIDTLSWLRNLTVLHVPADLLWALCITVVGGEPVHKTLPWRELRVLYPCDPEDPGLLEDEDLIEGFIQSLKTDLSNILLLQVPSMIVRGISAEQVDTLDEIVMSHLDALDDEELDEMVIEEVGFHIYDR